MTDTSYADKDLPLATPANLNHPLTIFDLPKYWCVGAWADWRDDFILTGIFTKEEDAREMEKHLRETLPINVVFCVKERFEWISNFFKLEKEKNHE